MVCDHCGSEAHRTGSSNCSKYCTLCKTNGYTEFPFPNGTICLALVRMEAKFGPRYAALELRLHKLYLLDIDPEIIDLTIEEPAPSSSTLMTPESTPKKRQRDPTIVDVDSL